METKQLVDAVVEAAQAKKAKEIKTIFVGEITSVAEYFVICTATSSTQGKAIANSIEHDLKELGIKTLRKEGKNTTSWVVLDYGSIIVHILDAEERDFYDLEKIWEKGKIEEIL